MYKIIFMLALTTTLVGCSNDPYGSYIGLWQREGITHPQILQIRKDGDTYLIDENILASRDIFGNEKKATVLSKSEGQLSVSPGLGSISLGLSEDKNKLHIADREYKKISESEFDQVKARIEKDRIERERNTQLCKSLNEEYQTEKSKLRGKHTDIKERIKQERALGEQFRDKCNDVPNCALMAFLL